jgi:hypothetical protein
VDGAVLAPIVVTTGWLLTRWCRDETAPDSPGHPALYVGITTPICLPLLMRPGMGSNSTVLSRRLLPGLIIAGGNDHHRRWDHRGRPDHPRPTNSPPPYRLIVVKPNRRTG